MKAQDWWNKNHKNVIYSTILVLTIAAIVYSAYLVNNGFKIQSNSSNAVATVSNSSQQKNPEPLLSPEEETSLRLQAKAKNYTKECEEALFEFAKEKNAKARGVPYTKKEGLPTGYECSSDFKIQKIIDQILNDNPEKEITFNEEFNINRNLPSDVSSKDVKDQLLYLGFKYISR